jgi:hypothetical protein
LCLAAGDKDSPPRPSAPADAQAADEADLDAMQGRWTYDVTNAAGVKIRIEKSVDGNADTVTHFDANGNTIYAHASTFELKRHGPLKIFTILKSTVIAGPDQGRQRPGNRSYVYRIEGDNLIECWGLLETDRGPPHIILWTRAK